MSRASATVPVVVAADAAFMDEAGDLRGLHAVLDAVAACDEEAVLQQLQVLAPHVAQAVTSVPV